MSDKELVRAAFARWQSGEGGIGDLLADNVRWTIEGHSLAARTYEGKQQLIAEMFGPFGRRLVEPLRPTLIKGVFEDEGTVIVHWDGEGKARDGAIYANTYVWVIRLEGGLIVQGNIFYDAITFNDLWTRVTPA